MGNPGINKNFNFTTISTDSLFQSISSTQSFSDYREYILNVLPDLKYLDGMPTYSVLLEKSSSQETSSNGSSNSISTNSPPRSYYSISESKSRKNIRTPSFKDLFYISKRRNSYQSSSTN